MIRFKSFIHSPQAVLFLALLLIATFGASCGGANRNSTSSSSSSAPGGGEFEGEITSKTFIGDQTMESRYAIKGARNRIPGFHRLVAYERLGRDLSFEFSAAGRGGRRR